LEPLVWRAEGAPGVFVSDPGAAGIARALQGGEDGEGRADQVAVTAEAALGADVSALAERLGDASAAEAMLGQRGVVGAHPDQLTAAGGAFVVQGLDQPAWGEGGAGTSPAPEPDADVGLLDGQAWAVGGDDIGRCPLGSVAARLLEPRRLLGMAGAQVAMAMAQGVLVEGLAGPAQRI
jgi:hypothetical protein